MDIFFFTYQKKKKLSPLIFHTHIFYNFYFKADESRLDV